MLSKTAIYDLLDFIFPRYCLLCQDKLINTEKHFCTSCLSLLPYNYSSLKEIDRTEQRLRARFDFTASDSFLCFDKGGNCQKLIHAIKYRNEKDTWEYMGEIYGLHLKENMIFNSIDVIIPVPLFKKKEKKRGYNQSEYIARGIARALNKPLSTDNLIKTKDTESQTLYSAGERWENVKDSFKVTDAKMIAGKHILLVDDVLTTGATLEACALEILKIPGTRISLSTLAIAEN